MTRWSAKTILILLVLLLLVSVALRYPLVEHERYQTDSYFIHRLSDAIVTDGRAEWIYHPLSYIGYYPLSYPSGVPFLLADISSLSGLTVEQSILVMDIMVAVLFCLGAFLVAKHFVRRPELAILVTYFTILGSRFVDTTYWDGSARGPVLALMILTVAMLLRLAFSWNLRIMGVCLVIVCGSIACHHMAILLLLFGVAYVMTMIECHYVLRRLKTHRRAHAVIIGAVVVAVVIIVPFMAFDYFWQAAVRGMQGSSLFNFESEVLTVIFVGSTSYINQIGPILVFAVLYVPVLLFRERLSERNLFPFFLLAVFTPVFGETLYVSMILSLFAAIFGVMWFETALASERMRRAARVLLVSLIVVSMAVPIWSVDRWNSGTFASGDQVLVDNQVFNDASYLSYGEDWPIAMCNVIPVKVRLEALSGTGFIGAGVSLALNGDVTKEEVLEGIQRSPSTFPKNIYNWYEFSEEPPVDRYVRFLNSLGVSYLYGVGEFDGGREYFSGHSKMIVVIDNRWPSSYVTHTSESGALFPEEVVYARSYAYEVSHDVPLMIQSYVFYQSQLASMYLVQLPMDVAS